MKGRELIDLHGQKFVMGDYTVSVDFPKGFTEDSRLVLTSDPSLSSFILVRFGNGEFGYILYVNCYYIYGKLKYLGYDSKKDIRYVKKSK